MTPQAATAASETAPALPSAPQAPVTSEAAPAAHATAATPPASEGATAGNAPNTDANTAPAEPPVKIAVLLPSKDSVFSGVTQSALNGIVASNYAAEKPAEILLVHPDASGNIVKQAQKAAEAGAVAAIGPIDRTAVETLAKLNYLPLPIVTLNQIEIDKEVPLTPEELKEQQLAREAALLADEAQRELNVADTTEVVGSTASEEPSQEVDLLGTGSIAAKISVPGFTAAEDLPPPSVRYEPKVFPHQFLMLGLSMEEDALYVTELGLKALPRLTESGKHPKVLLIDGNSPLEKRISQAFEKSLTLAGFAPDRLTVDLDAYRRVNQFFQLVVERDETMPEEELIDQEADPQGWRQQQIRLRREEAALRARAALAEPPYHAIFLALESPTASLVRSRLPMRSRLWATSAVNPGDAAHDADAKALTYDLRQVGLVDSPFVLTFDPAAFEEKYKTVAPKTMLERRLFALGSDALTVALTMAKGSIRETIDGLTGRLTYDLEHSPVVHRRGQTAMITGGAINVMPADELIAFQVVTHGSRLKRQAESAPVRKPGDAPALVPETGDVTNGTAPESETPAEALDLTTQALPE